MKAIKNFFLIIIVLTFTLVYLQSVIYNILPYDMFFELIKYIPLIEMGMFLEYIWVTGLNYDIIALISTFVLILWPLFAIIGCLRLKKSSWMYRLFVYIPLIVAVLVFTIDNFLGYSGLQLYTNPICLIIAILADILNSLTKDDI